MEIHKVPINTLTSPDWNPRQITEEELTKLENSLKEFGYIEPIIVNDVNMHIVGGNQRAKALKQLGYTEVDVVYVHIEDLAKEKACNVALNKISGDWDNDKLKVVLEEIELSPIDVSLTGFDEIELTEMEIKEPVDVAEDDFEVPSEEEVEVTVKYGDLYQLGNHKLMCGDSTKEEDVAKLMDGEQADMVFTDPPYNVDYSNIDRPKPSKTDLGKIKNDVMNDEEFYNFLTEIYKNLDLFTRDNSSFYIWYADKSTIEFYTALKNTNILLNQMIIWKKPMLLGRGKYQWAHEPCIFAVKGSPYFTEDRTKTTVWDFGGYNKSNNVHPTQKPLFLPIEAIQNSSEENQNILDVFGGSGSTLISCEQLNRNCYMMELDPYYCQVIINRWEEYTGQKATKIN